MTIFPLHGRFGATDYYLFRIDGIPFRAASISTLVGPVNTYEYVYDGLKLKDQEFAIQCDPITSKLNVNGLTVELVDVDNRWSQLFGLKPTARTWLSATCTDTDTSIEVEDTTQFPDAGVIFLDSETITYTSKDPTHFLGCTRGAMSTSSGAATYHYVITDSSVVNQRIPEITNWPTSWMGRRIALKRYDDQNPAGNDIYVGIITTAPSFDGTTWKIGIDHITSLLNFQLGPDLSSPATPAGVTYPVDYPFRMDVAVDDSVVNVVMSGHWADNGAFCDELTTTISDALTNASISLGTGGALVAEELTNGWQLRYHTPSSSPKDVKVRFVPTPVYPEKIECSLGCIRSGILFAGQPGPEPVPDRDWGYPNRPMDAYIGPYNSTAFGTTWNTNTDYWFGRPMSMEASTNLPFSPDQDGLGGVPRGVFSYSSSIFPASDRTIYFDGASPISGLVNAVNIKLNAPSTSSSPGGGTAADTTFIMDVESVDSVNRSITFVRPESLGGNSAGWWAFRPGHLPEIHFGIRLTSGPTGDIDDVMSFIVANQAQYSPLGVIPPIRGGDIFPFSLREPLTQSRIFTTFSPITLNEIVIGELQAGGHYLGSWGTRIQSFPISSLDDRNFDTSFEILTDKNLAQSEINGLGQINTVTYPTLWDPVSNNYEGYEVSVRDVTSFAGAPQTAALKIQQKSVYSGDASTPRNPVTPVDITRIAIPWFGAFGTNYLVDTIQVPRTIAYSEPAAGFYSYFLGSPIRYTIPFVISNSSGTTDSRGYPSGTLGETRVGIVIGIKGGFYDPHVTFTVIHTLENISNGYSLSGPVSSGTLTGTDTYLIEVGTGGEWDPSSLNLVSTYLGTPCPVEIVEADVESATVYTGSLSTVFSNTSPPTATIAMEPSFPGFGLGTDYYIRVPAVPTATTNERKYAYVANERSLIAEGGATQEIARVFSP